MPLEWLEQEDRKLFEEAGVGDNLHLLNYRGGEVVSTARTRSCRRIEIGGNGYFLKTQDLREASLPLRKWPSYFFHGSPILREARTFPILRALGWGTPLLVAVGWLGGWPWPRASLLLTREAPGHVDLARFPGPAARARAWAGALRKLIGDTHAQGFVLGGVRFRNFLVPLGAAPENPGPKDLLVLDQPRLRRGRSKRLQQKDLRYLDSDLNRLLARIEAAEAHP